MTDLLPSEFFQQTRGTRGPLLLAQACLHCPAVVPPGGGARSHMPSARSIPLGRGPLSILLRNCATGGHSPALRRHILKAMVVLLKAGCDPSVGDQRGLGDVPYEPAWHQAWEFLLPITTRAETGRDGLEVLKVFLQHVSNPGLRWQGQTFLHAFARRLAKPAPPHLMEEAWALLEGYPAGDLKAWSRLASPSPAEQPVGMKTTGVVGHICHLISQSHSLNFHGLVQALTWAGRFVAMDVDANETGPGFQDNTAAHFLAQGFGLNLLDERVRPLVLALNLEFSRPNAKGITAMDVMHQKNVQSETHSSSVRAKSSAEIAAMLIEFQMSAALPFSAATSATPRARL